MIATLHPSPAAAVLHGDCRKVRVGDVLWYGKNQASWDRTSRDFAGPSAVLKVGRAWITTEHGRFDRETMREEDSSHGKLYASQADHLAEIDLRAAWQDFEERVRRGYGPPAGITLDTIRQVETLFWPEATPSALPPEPAP